MPAAVGFEVGEEAFAFLRDVFGWRAAVAGADVAGVFAQSADCGCAGGGKAGSDGAAHQAELIADYSQGRITVTELIRKWKLGLALLLVLFPVAGRTSESQISFCELVSHPESYNAKEVTVRATYVYGYEWSFLYCLSCRDKGRAWLDISGNALDDASVKALKERPKGAGIVNVTVRGMFIKCDGCGHQNGYPFKLVAHQIRDVAVIVEGMDSSDKAKEAERKWACGGANPK